MQVECGLKNDLLESLKEKVEVKGPNYLLEDFLNADDEDDMIFEERTRKALEHVEARGVKGKPANEFLKEMETW